MSVLINNNGSLVRQDAAAIAQLAAVDTEGILGGTPGATTDGQTLVDQLAADDVQAQTDIGQIKTDLSDQQGEIEAILNVYGSKNILENKAVTTTLYGVTWTVNADKTISTNNTQSESKAFTINGEFTVPESRDYFINGCPAGGADNKYFFYLYDKSTGSNVSGRDYGNGATVSLVTGHIYSAFVWVVGGQDMSGKTFSPMIVDARIKDSTYVPYAPTNRECVSYAANTVLGAHNLLPNFAVAQTKNGITFAIDSDGVITANGTLTSDNTYILVNIYSNGDLPIPSGKYRGSGAPKTYTGTATAVMNFYNFNGNSADNYDRGDGIELDYVRGSNFNVAVIVSGGVGKTVTNAKFYPMLTDIRDTDRTYVPYAMTNRELTEVKDITSSYSAKSGVTLSTYTTKVYKCGKQIQGILRFTLPSNVSSNAAIIGITSEALPAVQNIPCGIAYNVWTGIAQGMMYFDGEQIRISGASWTASQEVMLMLNYIAK